MHQCFLTAILEAKEIIWRKNKEKSIREKNYENTGIRLNQEASQVTYLLKIQLPGLEIDQILVDGINSSFKFPQLKFNTLQAHVTYA